MKYERELRAQGAIYIAGVDEVGRGALAGPVIAAAVVLPPETSIEYLHDSKLLTPDTREKIFPIIVDTAIAVGIGSANRSIIDKLNILQATRIAMAHAVFDLPLDPDGLLIDAVHLPRLNIQQKAIIHGDSLSQSIAAASVIAKVIRDNMMRYYHLSYPSYGFDRHKGYATRYHLEAIKASGPCQLHRTTFRGVKEHVPHHVRPGD